MKLPYFQEGDDGNEIVLSDPQHDIFDAFLDGIRFIMLVAGRRFGKTVVVLSILCYAILNKPGEYAYIAPSRSQARRLLWKPIIIVMRPYIKTINKTELEIEFINGSILYLASSAAAERIRGLGLCGAIFDEYADCDPADYEEIVEPALADNLGWCIKVGTPKGFNHFKDDFDNARGREGGGDYKAFQFTTMDGGNVDEKEINRVKGTKDKRVFAQEFLASFETLGNRVYYTFSRANNVDDDIGDDDGELLIGMDFNVNPMSAVVAVRAGGQLHFFDEIEIEDAGTEQMCEEINRRYPGRSISVYPDPSGKARKTSAKVGTTDFTIIKQAGFHLIAPSKAPPVVDRVNTVNSAVESIDGTRRVFVHPRCKALIAAFEGLQYKKSANVIDKTGGLDHIIDAAGYLIYHELPIVESGLVRVPVSGV